MSKQPIVPFSISKWVHVLNNLSIIVILSSIVFVIRIFPTLPDTIPIHYAQGEADRWGSKATIFLLQGFALLVFVSLYFLSKKPHLFNYPFTITEENAPRIYSVANLFMTILNFECVLIFTYLSIDFVGQYSGTWLLITVFAFPLVTIFIFILVLTRLK